MSHYHQTSTSILTSSSEARPGPILIVEDDPIYAKVLHKRLRMHDFEVVRAENGEEGLRLAREIGPDLIITDWMMPRLDGVSLCREIRLDQGLEGVYIILLSNRSNTQEKVEGLEAGADDYLVKTCDTEELIARVQAGFRIRALQRALIHQTRIDGLTGLFNRRHFYARLEEELRRAERYGAPPTLAMIDLDRFKSINDTCGHLAGDAAIHYAATVISANCRGSDVICRYGGDEFAVLFINADRSHAEAVMERVSAQMADQPFVHDGIPVPFGLSYGLASSAELPAPLPDDLVSLADQRLYDMKRERQAAIAD